MLFRSQIHHQVLRTSAGLVIPRGEEDVPDPPFADEGGQLLLWQGGVLIRSGWVEGVVEPGFGQSLWERPLGGGLAE